MQLKGTTLAFCVLFGTAGAVSQADASQTRQEGVRQGGKPAAEAAMRKSGPILFTGEEVAGRPQPVAAWRPAQSPVLTGRGISCVPYARMVTGMAITGNGWQWWGNAAGVYSRGQQPEPGSVLAFRSTSFMPMGHVAVVSRMVGSRHLLIDHANWAGPGIRRGSVMRNVSVVDVSEENDWTAVRVQVGHDHGSFGRVYPTYGFIHNRPEAETLQAAAPRRRATRFEQVAEMPPSWQQDAALESFGITPSRR